MSRYLTSKELQDLYKISRSTIDRWRREGLPSEKIGRGVRFDEDSVVEWIKNNKKSEK